jgi:hypothetical protein
MKIGTFTEARHSLVKGYRKNMLGHRGVMIALWCQLAFIVGMICLYLFIRASVADVMVSAGFWLFVIGLPVLTLVLGIYGILPGTRHKKSV